MFGRVSAAGYAGQPHPHQQSDENGDRRLEFVHSTRILGGPQVRGSREVISPGAVIATPSREGSRVSRRPRHSAWMRTRGVRGPRRREPCHRPSVGEHGPTQRLDVSAWNDRSISSGHSPCACSLALVLALTTPALALEPIPDKLVVLTFDDASRSHVEVAAPLLKTHGFGATFFVTEGFDFPTNKRDYMTWDEIARLHRDGFEIGNHTRDHKAPNAKDPRGTIGQLEAIDARCLAHGIPRPVSFAYPGNALDKEVLPLLRERGIKFARRGGAPEYPYDKGRGFAYEPGLDHPLLIPSAGDGRPDWTLDDFKRAVSQARGGKIAVIQLHGVPDTAHSWVNTPTPSFESYSSTSRTTVIA